MSVEVGGRGPAWLHPGSSPQAERAGGDVGWHPDLAPSRGALLRGHLASLEVTSWPLTSHSVLAFPADGRLGSEPALAKLCIPRPPLCSRLPGAEVSHSLILRQVLPWLSAAAACASVSPSGSERGKETKGRTMCQVLCWVLLGLAFPVPHPRWSRAQCTTGTCQDLLLQLGNVCAQGAGDMVQSCGPQFCGVLGSHEGAFR